MEGAGAGGAVSVATGRAGDQYRPRFLVERVGRRETIRWLLRPLAGGTIRRLAGQIRPENYTRSGVADGLAAVIRQLPQTMALRVFLVLTFSAGSVGIALPRQPQTPPSGHRTNQKEPPDDLERLRPKVRLGKVPAIAFGPGELVTKEKATQIRTCIARLADIEEPDFGLSATMSGEAFLPLPDQRESQAMILTDHRFKSSAALHDLVKIGPAALPFLLDSLSDRTPTKLKLEHRSVFGGMWLANELWGNPVNNSEMKVLGTPKGREEVLEDEKHVESYTVKIGDICLVAIGQIVGRGYHAVRYQPTACIVINSPTEDVKLRQQVRKIWASEDPARKLFNSLLLDYATEGVFQGESLDGWDLGSELQIKAAMRLLYYFPKQTAALLADRLRTLDVNKTSNHGQGSPATEEELDTFVRREVANGVRTDRFIKAVAWCQETKVREAVRAIFTRTDDVDILLAALPAIEDTDRDVIRDRLQIFLNAVPAQEGGAYGDGYNLLVALANRLGKDAAPAFARYLKDASAQRCHSAAQALQRTKGEWCVPILSRLLDDKRPVGGYTYAVHRADQHTRLPIRVCDVAAEALHFQHREWRFTLEGEYKELDKQIRVIRDKVTDNRH